MNEDYRSRALGVVGAIGVLVTGIVVDGARTRVRESPGVAVDVAVAGRAQPVARKSAGTRPVSAPRRREV